MLLSKLVSIPFAGPDIEISGITEDSRKVQPGFLFVAIPGVKQDGRDFIQDALRRGAVAVLAPEGTEPIPSISTVTTTDLRRATADVAATFYPKQPEVIAAVTGTSGKTSTAQFAREIWQALGKKSASIGTLGLVTAKGTSYGSLTTPDAITLHSLLDECAGNGITHVSVEASSHGIELNRLDRVKIKTAGFTNLSRDHLDYHQNMEAYFNAKKGLFSEILPPGATAVLNADIERYPDLCFIAKKRGLKIISYGKNGGDLRIIKSEDVSGGQILTIDAFGENIEVLLPSTGHFQAWNALCAAGMPR